MTNDLWITGAVLIILGLITDIAGQILKSYDASKRTFEGYAEASVVDIVPIKRDREVQSEFRNRQAAVFQFYADGKLIKVIDKDDTYPCPYRLHERVILSYDPDDPEHYRIIRDHKKHNFAIFLNILGVVIILAGVFVFLAYALR